MVLDIIVGVILIGTTVYGLRKGFVFTFIHTVGWILAAVLAYLATPFVKEFLVDKTTVYEAIEEDLDLRFSDSVPVMETSEKSVPLNISDILQNSTEIVSSKMAGAQAPISNPFSVSQMYSPVLSCRNRTS